MNSTAHPETASHDTVSTHVRMVNQIASAAGYKSHDEAVTFVATHLHDFWTRAMLNDLIDYVDGGGEGVSQVVHDALNRETWLTKIPPWAERLRTAEIERSG